MPSVPNQTSSATAMKAAAQAMAGDQAPVRQPSSGRAGVTAGC